VLSFPLPLANSLPTHRQFHCYSACACQLAHPHCLFIYALFVHCLFTAYSPSSMTVHAYTRPLLFTIRCGSHIHCSLLIHYLSAYSPLHCLCTVYSLPIPAYSPAYALPMHCLFTASLVTVVLRRRISRCWLTSRNWSAYVLAALLVVRAAVRFKVRLYTMMRRRPFVSRMITFIVGSLTLYCSLLTL
jgi:hypothetical protein